MPPKYDIHVPDIWSPGSTYRSRRFQVPLQHATTRWHTHTRLNITSRNFRKQSLHFVSPIFISLIDPHYSSICNSIWFCYSKMLYLCRDITFIVVSIICSVKKKFHWFYENTIMCRIFKYQMCPYLMQLSVRFQHSHIMSHIL